jgi:tRNA-dihydrouridine synthase A
MNETTYETWKAPLSVAPMMQRTDRHYRRFMRCITTDTLLWSEMVTAKAILHGDHERLLAFDAAEHPLVLQLGGDDPAEMAEAARIGEGFGYDEININVGCPSSRVREGAFGACLMRRPERVGELVDAMTKAVGVPVTVKHRIGVDELDRYEDMLDFVRVVRDAGACARFTVHARKAWLQGLSPKENRNIPPLRYDEVWRLKQELPELVVEINGGIKSMDAVAEHLEHVDAVMIGRAAYDDPYMFVEADARFYGADRPQPTRADVVEAMIPYVERMVRDEGVKLHYITRHMTNLFAGVKGARVWRRYLSERHHLPGAGAEVLTEGLRLIQERAA